MMTTEKIIQLLNEYDVPSTFSHFSKQMQPPFIAYTVPNTDNFNADNIVYLNIDEIQIELYTRQNTLLEEKKLEDYMTKNRIIWEKTSQSWIDDEKVMMSIYEVG